MGVGAAWGTRDEWKEWLHPRGYHGRFKEKGLLNSLAKAIEELGRIMDKFNPRTFQSQQQANSHLFNLSQKAHGKLDAHRFISDFDHANDALRAGQMDPSTKKFVDMMDASSIELDDDLIVSKVVGADAFGLDVQSMHNKDGGLESMAGRLIADRGYSMTNIGPEVPNKKPGQITMRIALPGRRNHETGTRVNLRPGQRDSGVTLDRDQELRITKVNPDGVGGYYVMAVATPKTPGQNPEPSGGVDLPSLTPAEREAKLAASRKAPRPYLPKGQEGQTGGGSPEELRKAAQQATINPPATQTSRYDRSARLGTPEPSPTGPTNTGANGPAPRQEAIAHPAIGTAGGGATRQPTAPENVPEGAPAQPISLDFRRAARDAHLEPPSNGPRRREWNQAYQQVANGKGDPGDVVRMLEKDIDVNKERMNHLVDSGTLDKADPHLARDIRSQEDLADLIRREHGLGPRPAPERPKPVKKAAAPKKEAPKLAPVVPIKKEERKTSLPPVPEHAPSPRKAGEKPNLDDIHAKLEAKSADNVPNLNREQAGNLVNDLSRNELLDLAGRYNIPGAKSKTKEDLRREIVDTSVGRRLDSIAIRGFTGKSPFEPGRTAAEVEAAKKAAPEAPNAPTVEELTKPLTDDEIVAKAERLRRKRNPTSVDRLTINRADRILAERKKENAGKPAEIQVPTRGGGNVTLRNKGPEGVPPEMQKIADDLRAGRIDAAEAEKRIHASQAKKAAPAKKALEVKPVPKPAQVNDLNTATIADMKKIAADEGVDLKGKRLKADIRKAIEDKRSGKVPETLLKKPTGRNLEDGERLVWEPPGGTATMGQVIKRPNKGTFVEWEGGRRERISPTDKMPDVRRATEEEIAKLPKPEAPPVKEAAAPAKKAAAPKSFMSQMSPEERKVARDFGLPDDHPLSKLANDINDADSEDEALSLMADLKPDDVNQVGRQLGIKFHVDMNAEDRKKHIARSLAAHGSKPAPVKKATKAVPGAPEPGKLAIRKAAADHPIEAKDRRDAFEQAFMTSNVRIPDSAAGRTIKEVRDNIAKGTYSPNEGIRRLENDIALNKQDVSEIEGEIRAATDPGEALRLKAQRASLIRDIKHQEHASTFLQKHFREAPDITVGELNLTPEEHAALDKATPDTLRKSAKLAGLGDLKGETKDELITDFIRKMAQQDLAKKAVKKVAPPKAPDVPKPDIAESPYKRIDVNALAEGLDLPTPEDKKMLKSVQDLLDGKDPRLGKNPTPKQVADDLEKAVDGPVTRLGIAKARHGTAVHPFQGETGAEHKARLEPIERELEAAQHQATEMMKLADRLKNTRRVRKEHAPEVRTTEPKLAAPEKADIAKVAEATGIPAPQLEKKALAKKVAEAPPRANAQQVADTLKTVGSREEGATLLKNHTKAELLDIRKALGFEGQPIGGSKVSKSDLIDQMVDQTVGQRLESEAIKGMNILGPSNKPKVGGYTRQELGDMSLGDLVAIEDELGIKRGSLARGDRIDAIMEAQGFQVSPSKRTSPGAVEQAVEPQAVQEPTVKARARTGRTDRGPVHRTAAESRAKDQRIHQDNVAELVKRVRDLNDAGASDRAMLVSARGLVKAQEDSRYDVDPDIQAEAKDLLDAAERGDRPAVMKAADDLEKKFKTGGATPAKKKATGAVPVTPPRQPKFSDKPLLKNTYGTGQGEVHFHPDGAIGEALAQMGEENQKLNIDGEPLGNVLGKLATDTVAGKFTTEQMLSRLKEMRDRISEARAKRALGDAINKIDSPKVTLDIPTNIPPQLKELLQALAKNPLTRQPGSRGIQSEFKRAEELALEIARNDGKFSKGRLLMEIHRLLGQKHESQEGYYEAFRAIQKAERELRG